MAGNQTGELWSLIRRYMDQQRYRPSERQIAAELGVTPTSITKWKRGQVLPARENLVAIARLTGVPYLDVLNAALIDREYLPRESDRGDASPMTEARDDAGLTGEMWDRRAEPLRAAGYTDRAIVDTLGPRPATLPGEVAGGADHNTAGHSAGDRRQQRTS